jgi:flagellar motor switch protein FliN/FliY
MANGTPSADVTRPRIASHIQTSFQRAASGLTGKDFTVSIVEKPVEAAALAEPIIWQQSFSVLDSPSLWLYAGRDLWESLARITLEAAGIDPVTEEDSRSTWQEIIGQTMGGLATELTGDLLREVTSTQGIELTEEPASLSWIWMSVSAASDGAPLGPWLLRAAWSTELAAASEPKRAEDHQERPTQEVVSKTFDLLLDVALPVSVSFGKTSLQIREVLKLNTGSIVELNRFVTDPVDVIVNDCVIARGEVVVVDGNYGVRINQLATREDRLRTGMGEGPRIGMKP